MKFKILKHKTLPNIYGKACESKDVQFIQMINSPECFPYDLHKNFIDLLNRHKDIESFDLITVEFKIIN